LAHAKKGQGTAPGVPVSNSRVMEKGYAVSKGSKSRGASDKKR